MTVGYNPALQPIQSDILQELAGRVLEEVEEVSLLSAEVPVASLLYEPYQAQDTVSKDTGLNNTNDAGLNDAKAKADTKAVAVKATGSGSLSQIVPTADGWLSGAPLYGGLRILSFASNRIIAGRDATAHSELLAIRAACQAKRSERLPQAALITSLEPCLMCSGAIILARLQAVYFFAPTLKGAGLRWLLKQSRPAALLNHYPEVHELPQFQSQYSRLLRRFFAKRRPVGKGN